MASMEDLRKARTAKKSLVTKGVNELRRLVVDDAYSEIVEKFDLIKGVFHTFMEAHNAYHENLTDESDILASDKYLCEVECNYIDGLKDVRKYINSGPGYSASSDGSLIQSKGFKSSVSYVKLPPVPQPDVFCGKPETYPMWKASFNTLVGKFNIGYDEKMFYLKQYTAGEARDAIEALFLCPGKSSYEAALTILEDRFGNTSLVASAYRKRLESWPKVGERDGKALQRFADFLKQICVAKQSYKSLDILSDEFENRKLLNKLPAWLVNKWIERVVDNSSLPNFEEFANFIKDKATIANHSLWAEHSSASIVKKSQWSKPDSRVQGQSHVVQAGLHARNVQSQTGHRACPVCSNEHKITKCSVFGEMSLTDRRSVIRDKNLCFGCLACGHQSKNCRNRHVCAVCIKRHPTLLHDYSLHPQTTNPITTTDNVNLATTTNDNISLASDLAWNLIINNRATTMILPVVLRHASSDKEVLVYAVLDTQSNTNFVTEEIRRMLNVSGRHTTLELTTMNGRMNVPTKAIEGFRIRGVSDGPFIDIAACYTRDSIPCRRESIPTAEVLNKWPHLAHVSTPRYYQNAPIGLLIGYHCPQVMRQLEIATAGEYEPFGWKTSLGWC